MIRLTHGVPQVPIFPVDREAIRDQYLGLTINRSHKMETVLQVGHEWRKHGTEHEKMFLRNLGSYSPNVELSRIALLRLYLGSMAARWNWAGIDRQEIERYVLEMIARESLPA